MTIKIPRYTIQKYVPLKSPMALGGFFIHFLRTRFREGQEYVPWYWDSDLTKTQIIIETGDTVTNEQRNQRPALWVNVGRVSNNPIVIGSDSHISYGVGNFENAVNLIEEIGFPEELVVNTSVDKLKKFLNKE